MNKSTLTLKKPAATASNGNQQSVPQKKFFEDSLPGKRVTVQGKSPSQWDGVIESFKFGWLILNGEERRWQHDGSLSDVVCKGRFCIERSAINYIAEVCHD